MKPLIKNHGQWDAREYVVAREAHAQSRVSIRTADWKYIKHIEDPILERERGDSLHCGYCNKLHGATEELYNLAEDSDETKNIVDQYPDRVTELEMALESYEENLHRPTIDVGQQVTYEHESRIMDHLEDLGYR